jgi:hypothetical protein
MSLINYEWIILRGITIKYVTCNMIYAIGAKEYNKLDKPNSNERCSCYCCGVVPHNRQWRLYHGDRLSNKILISICEPCWIKYVFSGRQKI